MIPAPKNVVAGHRPARSAVPRVTAGPSHRGADAIPEWHTDFAVDLDRLASLLGAGLSPAVAWGHIVNRARPAPATTRKTFSPETARPRPRWARGMRPSVRPERGIAVASPARITAVEAALHAGEDPATALMGPARSPSTTGHAPLSDAELPWHRLAAVWSASALTGAALAEGIRVLAKTLRARARVARDVAASAAGPRASARLVGVIPLLSLFFGEALGFPIVYTLVGTPPGRVLLAVGLLLLLLTALWIRLLVRRAFLAIPEDDVLLDLTAMMLGAGIAPASARWQAHQILARCRLDASESADERLRETLGLAHDVGVPAQELLHAEAQDLRERRARALQRAATALETKLLIPLGVGALPAFVCLGVGPLILSLLGQMLSSPT
ncbi:hypothetical protein D9V32_13870 [Mycetocola tolaasinivorans]|uniref:Type II secretion system protein GspF domain-containing protein n=1 Tax=Mycetocola tolaasinivorans TaxID=76635 RepID=A0A3L7A1G5_9MICO|nr:type II secretion system F family protein [Mycetocola tolaasinivorans]RLP74126.1 hypothetical protein D9V32_13870 [Mycetocola tolaasinivorans]